MNYNYYYNKLLYNKNSVLAHCINNNEMKFRRHLQSNLTLELLYDILEKVYVTKHLNFTFITVDKILNLHKKKKTPVEYHIYEKLSDVFKSYVNNLSTEELQSDKYLEIREKFKDLITRNNS